MLGVIIVNKKGVAIKSTMNQQETIDNGSLITQFTDKAQMTIKTLHPEEEITFIKIRSSMYEIMIAPDKEFSLIVLQDDPSNIAKNQWTANQPTNKQLIIVIEAGYKFKFKETT